jgi:hypothetical protein
MIIISIFISGTVILSILMPICDLNPGSTAVLLFFISGVTGTFSYKLMGSQTVSEGGHERSFYHPYM